MEITYKTVGKLAERYGFDFCHEYGEPGYSLPYGASDGAGIILGDYRCRCGKVLERFDAGASHWTMIGADDPTAPGERRAALHDVFHHYPRLGAALEESGWQLEWVDEWVIDWGGEGKCYRTQADSYSWQPTAVWTDDGDLLTPESGIDAWIDYMVNDHHRAMPRGVFSDEEIDAAGFREYRCGYENGWHPGQTDDPREITDLIREELGDGVDVMFQLSTVGQFDLSFCVWVRETGEDDDT